MGFLNYSHTFNDKNAMYKRLKDGCTIKLFGVPNEWYVLCYDEFNIYWCKGFKNLIEAKIYFSEVE